MRPVPFARCVPLVALAVLIAPAPAVRAQAVSDVKVERVRPRKEKNPTLRFLKENRDFIRARFDLLRERPGDHRGDGVEIDPRFLAYQEMLQEVFAAKDSVAVAADARARQDLLASISQLGTLESELDLMDRLLAAQRRRLARLEGDFTGRQQTALVVVLSGAPAGGPVSEVKIALDDGATFTVSLSAEQRQSLEHGGIVQVFHGFVEPRAQAIEVALHGEGWSAADSGFVTLEPARDRLTFLKLDLAGARPERGVVSIQASTWLHDARLPSRDG